MSIQNNTAGLETILQAVNNLPEAAPAGVAVQKRTGDFTTNNSGTATVNCGFKPDFVAVDGGSITSGANAGVSMFAGVAFEGGNITEGAINSAPASTQTAIQTTLIITQSSTGFSVSAIDLSTSYSEVACKNRTFEYVAVKYT